MASGRMLQRKISKSHDVARLIQNVCDDMGLEHGAFAALLFTWCISHQDVNGRMHGDPRLVRSEVFPLIEDIATSHVARYLGHMHAIGLVVWYEVGGRKWLEFPGFKDAQPNLRRDREPPSTIPDPSEGTPVGGGQSAGSPPAQLRLLAGPDPGEEKIKRREEKGREGGRAPSELGKPENDKQESVVRRHEEQARQVLQALNEARQRLSPKKTGIRPTFTSLAGIAGRLEAGKSLEECLEVVRLSEVECSRKPESLRYFDQVTPWRPTNFERLLASVPDVPSRDIRVGHAKPSPHNQETTEYEF